MHRQVVQLRNELELVDWYIENLENGISSHDILRMHNKLKKKHDKFLVRHERTVTTYQDELKKTRTEL